MSYGGVLKDGVDGVDGLGGARVTVYGSHAYVAGHGDAALSWFVRDPVTGALSYAQTGVTYVLTAADADSVITVVASHTDDGTTTETVSSAGTATVQFPNQSPTFTTSASTNAPENQTLALALNASDPDGDLLTFSISGGADAAKFSIHAVTGVLSFLSPPDFEANASAANDNAYMVTVQVTDGNANATQTVTVNLLNDPADDPVPPGNEYQSPDGGYQTPGGEYQSPGDGHQSPDDNATDQNQSTTTPTGPVYVPIVSTHFFTKDTNGNYVFGGQVLADGGSSVLEVGILISRSIFFVEPIRLPAGVDLQTQEFSITHHGLEPGTIHYYRAYARNAVGETQGVTRKLKTLEYAGPSPWWAGMPESAGGWRTSDWFGAFRLYGRMDLSCQARVGLRRLRWLPGNLALAKGTGLVMDATGSVFLSLAP